MDIFNNDFPCPKCTSIDYFSITNDCGVIRSCTNCNFIFNIKYTESRPKSKPQSKTQSNLKPIRESFLPKPKNTITGYNNHGDFDNHIEKPFL